MRLYIIDKPQHVFVYCRIVSCCLVYCDWWTYPVGQPGEEEQDQKAGSYQAAVGVQRGEECSGSPSGAQASAEAAAPASS